MILEVNPFNFVETVKDLKSKLSNFSGKLMFFNRNFQFFVPINALDS
jgi:hypothetical protein